MPRPDHFFSDLAQTSVQAAIAAIDSYNKPNLTYREEAFAILIIWELYRFATLAIQGQREGKLADSQQRHGDDLFIVDNNDPDWKV
jgi:hypothetical protein